MELTNIDIASLKKQYLYELTDIYPQREIENIYLELVLEIKKWNKIDFLLHENIYLIEAEVLFLKDALKKLKQNIPLQHIIGYVTFHDLKIKVTKDTLIPRPETEELVQLIYQNNRNKSKLDVLDIGTGSGCIVIALKLLLKNSNCYGIDISKKAITIAKENARNNNSDVVFYNKDVFKYSLSKNSIDIIVSNPPYIPELDKKKMHLNVLNNEPHIALFVKDTNPLIFYEKIADIGLESLKKNGLIYLEIHEDYANDVVDLLKHKNYINCKIQKDFQGKNRFVVANRYE